MKYKLTPKQRQDFAEGKPVTIKLIVGRNGLRQMHWYDHVWSWILRGYAALMENGERRQFVIFDRAKGERIYDERFGQH